MTSDEIWNDEEPIAERFEGIEVPEWIDPDISPSTVAAIVQGGCDSGAYTPAVTYHEALEMMAEHGDTVLDFLDDAEGYDIRNIDGLSWAGMACFFLSRAVEIWASNAYAVLEDFEPDEDEEDE